MKFSAYFILISYLMAGAGLAAVSLTDVISYDLLIAAGILIILSFFLSLSGKPFNIPGFIWNSLAIIILSAGLIDYVFISQSLIDVSIRFLTLLMAAKLFDLKTNRDYAILYLVTFFQLLAASASTVNLSFLFALTLYILTGIWALTVFNLKKDWEEKSAGGKEIAKNILSPYFFIATAGLAVLSLIITLSLFFVIPRMGAGFFPKKTADALKVSGFSEKIDFGDIGQIKLDPAIVMRVELPGYKGSAAPLLYFRGMSFDAYNGMQWQQTITQLTPLKRGRDGIWREDAAAIGWSAESSLLTQVILLEPIATNVLFAASGGIGFSGNFRKIVTDNAGSFYLPAPLYSRIEYTAYSLPAPTPKSIAARHDYAKEAPLQYLQLPNGIERVSMLAGDITSDKKTPFDKASAIEEYLKKNYRYTLNPGRGAGKNPVEDFLFFTREGYCEQYANAMAVMLRAIGIPSRLVTGFLPGEWNKFGNYLIIRNRDAHSWVEAYMPDSGWAAFDPTPSAETVGAMPPPASILSLYIDSLKWRWSRYIVNYSLQDQMNLARAMEGKGRSMLSKLRRETISNKLSAVIGREKRLILLIALSMVSAALIIAIIWRGLRQANKTRWSKTPLFYKDMLTLLSKKGKTKKSGETALEFAGALNIEGVKAITDIYYHVRFGGHKTTDKEKTLISDYLTAMKKIDV